MENENQSQNQAPNPAPVAPAAEPHTEAKVDALMVIATYILFFVPMVVAKLKDDPFFKFHARQSLGLLIASVAAGIVANFVMPVGSILQLAVFVLWVISILSALKGKQEPTPLIGEYFKKINI